MDEDYSFTMSGKITVVIVTRNKAKDLKDCLTSLARQGKKVSRLFIIDNNSSDNTREIIRNFKRRLPIDYFLEKKVGYSAVYNRGLKEVKTQWVAFIDDDCVAADNWYEEVIKATKKYPDAAAILGNSLNYHSGSAYACAFQFNNELWRLKNLDRQTNKILNYQILDSRNIVYNKQKLNEKEIAFDEKLDQLRLGGEDMDLGMQIYKAGLKASYAKKMLVFHKEPNSLKWWFLKTKFYAKSDKYFEKKWGKELGEIEEKYKKKKLNKWALFSKTTKDLSTLQRIYVMLLILLNLILNFLIPKLGVFK